MVRELCPKPQGSWFNPQHRQSLVAEWETILEQYAPTPTEKTDLLQL